jgi:hypothetical protein
MSWLYSQVLVEEYLGDNFSDGEQSVPLNGSHTQLAYLPPDKMTAFSRLSRFGMTFKPLTEDLGEELLKSFREDFLVKTFPLQEKEMDLTESDQECGDKWRGSFAKWDQSTSLWRTHQCSFLGDLEPFSETYPQWGLMRNGELWEQKTLVQTTKGTESGLWLTPTVMDGLPARNPEALERQYQNNRKGRTTHSTLRATSSLPTTEANVSDSKCLGWQERSSIRGASQNKESTSDLGHGSSPFGKGELSDSMCNRLQGSRSDGIVEGQIGLRCRKGRNEEQNIYASDSAWWSVEPELGRVAHGVADRVHRLKAIGNGQVPLCAATAWGLLK